MEKLQLFLLILQVVIAVVMILLILIQRSDGDSLSGIGGGSGGLGSAVSSKASANALTKFTIFLAAFFMLNSLVLARISSIPKSTELQIDKVLEEKAKIGNQGAGNAGEKPENQKPSLPPVE